MGLIDNSGVSGNRSLNRRRTGYGFWLLVLLVVTAAGCESLGYYSQAAGGQIRLLYKRADVNKVLADLQGRKLDARQQALQKQLMLSQELLRFAENQIGLDVGRRYRTYVELDDNSVVWNLFAAAELSLEPKRWCYPFVGCAPYRGYFNRQRALSYQEKLSRLGMDTYLGGVAAYSTLGWFNDPLLSSFIDWPPANLADLLFHELAHSRIWLQGDVSFNEGFASFVGEQGMREWLVSQDRSEAYQRYLQRRHTRQNFLALLRQTRAALSAVYAGPARDDDKRQAKAQVLAAARRCFDVTPERFGGQRYAGLMAELNNALLVSMATYDDNVSAFAALFSRADGAWPAFFISVEELTLLAPDEREAKLADLREGEIADGTDNDGSEQIQCESLTSHGVDTDVAGTEHNNVGRRGNRQHEGTRG